MHSKGKSTSSTTKSQDSSVLDTLATLATATLSHSASSISTTPQQVTAAPGRPIGITPLTLPPTTPTFTTPLTPSSLFSMPSPLAALSALSSLSSPAQTSPLPLSFPMPVIAPQQVTSSAAQLVPLVQAGGAPFFSSATGMAVHPASSSVASAGDPTSATTSSPVISAGTSSTNASVHSVVPQTILTPLQLPSGSNQAQLALSQMLTPIQGVQPSVVLELNTATTSKDGVGTGKSFCCTSRLSSLTFFYQKTVFC